MTMPEELRKAAEERRAIPARSRRRMPSLKLAMTIDSHALTGDHHGMDPRTLARRDQRQARTRELDGMIYRALFGAIALWCLLGGVALLMLAGWLPMPEWAPAHNHVTLLAPVRACV